MSRHGEFRVSLRVALAIGAIASVALTAALVHFPWNFTSRANVADLRERLNGQFIETIGRKVDGLLDGALSARMVIAENIAEGVIDMENRAQRRAFFLSFLRNAETLSAVEFGWPDDRYFVMRRIGQNEILIENTLPAAEGGAAMRLTEQFEVAEDGSLVLLRAETGSNDHPPTQQLWYKTAFDAEAPPWSDIYRLAASDKPGLTTAQTVLKNGGPAGEPLGVVGVSIELDRVSAFLDGLEAGPGGTIFLTNVYSELVASQNPMPTDTGTAAIGTLAKSGDALILLAARALEEGHMPLNMIAGRFELVVRDEALGDTFFVTFEPLVKMGLIVAIVTAESDVLGDIDANTRRLLYAVAIFILAVAGAVTIAARRLLGNPLVKVGDNIRRLETFNLEAIQPVPSRIAEIDRLSSAIGQMSASLGSFRKYIPTEIVRTLFEQGIEAELGGERRVLTILFMDLVGFTQLSERLGEDIIPYLGDYLGDMSREIQAREGTIDKYIGDAVMAFWGAPKTTEAHAELACRAALACQARLAELRRQPATEKRPPMLARIGLNTGSVLVGNFGSRERLNYTAIGDPVNVASRLEALNKEYGTEIIIGEDTYAGAKGAVVARRLDRVAVYGKAQGVDVFELIGLKGEVDSGTLGWIDAYERGYAAYLDRRWDEAVAQFERTIGLRGEDRPSRLMIGRAREFKAAPPPADWTGIAVQRTK